MSDKLTDAQIAEILACFIEAKRQVGQDVELAYLIDGDATKILLDNREEESLN